MRRLILTCTLLLPLLATAQINFHHYLDSTYAWFEYSWAALASTGQPPCYIGGDVYNYQRYHVVGMDTIDGHGWYQVHHDWEQEIQCGMGGPTIVQPGQSPALFDFRIREDSTGKIWMRDDFAGTRMLYDFVPGLSVGDTLWMNDYQDSCVIALIDTVYLGGDARRRFWSTCSVNSWNESYVVEGVGTNKAFSDFFGWCVETIDFFPRFACCQLDGNTLRLDTNVVCGRPTHNPVAVAEPVEMQLNVRWSADAQALVLQTGQAFRDFTWAVYDLNGRPLLRGDAFQDRIPVPSLAAGMYLFSATDGNQRRVLRFLKD